MRFKVEGTIKGKARPRFYQGHAVTPKATKDYEARIQYEYLHARGRKYETPVRVAITARFEPPKSDSGARRVHKIEHERPTKKPDADNIAKVVLDALNGLAYEDDKQVVDLRIRKMYGFNEELEIEIREVTP